MECLLFIFILDFRRLSDKEELGDNKVGFPKGLLFSQTVQTLYCSSQEGECFLFKFTLAFINSRYLYPQKVVAIGGENGANKSFPRYCWIAPKWYIKHAFSS